MPIYVIEHRIDTLLELWKPFNLNGFFFEAWSTDMMAGQQDGWIAKREVEADTVDNAFREFSKDFYRLVDRIGFVGQCYTAAELEPFRITKPADERFFWRYSKKSNPVPLHFEEAERRSLDALESYKEKGDAFRYLREASNSTSFYTRLVMLVSALEAMAGDIQTKQGPKTNKKYISNNILKDKNLCDKIFKHEKGIRNQILHGGFVDDDIHGAVDYNVIVYDSIVDYFNKNHGLEIDKKALGRPRTAARNYKVWSGWCRSGKDNSQASLQILNEKYGAEDAPAYFMVIDKPDDF